MTKPEKRFKQFEITTAFDNYTIYQSTADKQQIRIYDEETDQHIDMTKDNIIGMSNNWREK